MFSFRKVDWGGRMDDGELLVIEDRERGHE
jgi:hypothetical protein